MTTFFNMLAGAGTIFDMFPAEPVESDQRKKSDAEQLAEDWNMVGEQLRQAISQEVIEHDDKKQEK